LSERMMSKERSRKWLQYIFVLFRVMVEHAGVLDTILSFMAA
jgi:hypothetical protein